ncbi:carboxypeptidase-like regulatory domain-containing protein [Ascidiimonas aurantiaca]|uniref:carboxypeptidase-like regulatory domain-containing protein n=1 Tax=Ascidiimonas aurantiaca TaxID=1685432 RepID=UPI0030EE5106
MLLIFVFVSVLFSQIYAQNVVIHGFVKKSKSEGIENVSIVVESKQSSIIGYTFTDEKGQYSLLLSYNKQDSIKVIADRLGYQRKEVIFQIPPDQTKFEISFILNEEAEKLNEVVLEAWEKIKVKKDTIVYRASAFRDGATQTLEDLLKNIPAIDINQSGMISVNGKSISKLLIEGDDLFDDKYKILSRNLDAEVIDEIEILNNFEDNPVLKSFQESEKVALNLKLKADKRNIWFGNIDAGTGSNEQYRASINLGLLKKKIKFFNFFSANNIGNTSFEQIDNGNTITVSAQQTTKKTEKSNNELVSIDNVSDINFSRNEDIFNDSFINSLSFVTSLSKSTKLRSLTYYSFDQIEKQNSNFVQFFIQPDIVTFNENNKLNIRNIAFGKELELKYTNKDKTFISYDFTFENRPTSVNNKLIFNTDTINQQLNTNAVNFFNHLNITQKLSANKLLVTYAYLGINNTNQDFTIQPNIFEENNQGESSINQNLDTPLNYYGISTELIGKNEHSNYSVELTAQVDVDKINSRFSSNNFSIDSLLNNTKYQNSSLGAIGTYKYKISQKLSINSSISLSQNLIDYNNRKYRFFFVNPQMQIKLRKTRLGDFTLGYHFQNELPVIDYLNENFVLRNYRTFNRGFNDIETLANHNLRFNYFLNKHKKRFLINSFLIVGISNNSFGIETNVNENLNLNQFRLLDGKRFVSYNFNFTKYIRPLSTSFRLSTQHTWTDIPISINSITSKLNNYNANYRFQGTTYFNIPVNFKFHLQANFSRGDFQGQSSTNQYFESELTSKLKLSEKWYAQSTNNFYRINQNDFLFVNFSVNHTPEKSRWSYQLTGNNLTNINNYENVLITEFQRNESRFRIIPRYIILTAKYRF